VSTSSTLLALAIGLVALATAGAAGLHGLDAVRGRDTTAALLAVLLLAAALALVAGALAVGSRA